MVAVEACKPKLASSSRMRGLPQLGLTLHIRRMSAINSESFAGRPRRRLDFLELKTTARLVGALYATMPRFEFFKALTLLYFAVASYSEAARRLGKGHLAESFL